ncbi:MAG TPA: hypothetical protein VGT82_14370 [Ktedonobacteraceae bacterium]|nr:hypothetical protein [Ktedonobacteraceae bacterium]
MKMEQMQNTQTILSGISVVELTDSDLAKVQGGCSQGYDSQQYCQDDGGDWGDDSDGSDGSSYYKNSFNHNNNDNNNTNLNLLNGLSLL